MENAEVSIDKLFKEYPKLEELYVNDFGVYFTMKPECRKVLRKDFYKPNKTKIKK